MPVVRELAAIILAAGYSSRMSGFKPLLPFGDSTVIETAISIFRNAGIADINVVAGHRADELRPLLERAQVRCIVNPEYSSGMYSSVLAGIKALRPGIRGFFLLPVDIPLVSSRTIQLLAEAYEKLGPRIIYPVYNKERGHPPLIPSALCAEMISWQGEGGLKSMLERYEAYAVEVEVQDEGILLDIDTPQDYELACKVYGRGGKS